MSDTLPFNVDRPVSALCRSRRNKRSNGHTATVGARGKFQIVCQWCRRPLIRCEGEPYTGWITEYVISEDQELSW